MMDMKVVNFLHFINLSTTYSSETLYHTFYRRVFLITTSVLLVFHIQFILSLITFFRVKLVNKNHVRAFILIFCYFILNTLEKVKTKLYGLNPMVQVCYNK